VARITSNENVTVMRLETLKMRATLYIEASGISDAATKYHISGAGLDCTALPIIKPTNLLYFFLMKCTFLYNFPKIFAEVVTINP
jgi:hypothetical protein